MNWEVHLVQDLELNRVESFPTGKNGSLGEGGFHGYRRGGCVEPPCLSLGLLRCPSHPSHSRGSLSVRGGIVFNFLNVGFFLNCKEAGC